MTLKSVALAAAKFAGVIVLAVLLSTAFTGSTTLLNQKSDFSVLAGSMLLIAVFVGAVLWLYYVGRGLVRLAVKFLNYLDG